MRSIIKLSIATTSIIILSGCAAVTGHKGAMNDFDKVLNSGNCDLSIIDKKLEDGDTILWGAQGGSLARDCKIYNKSIIYLDKAEKEYKESVDKDNIAKNALESSTSMLVNNNVNEYEGNTYEKVMVNTYKALNFMNMNDQANARVEFNRALDRQRRAKEYFEKEIKEKKEELKKTSDKKEEEIAKKNQKNDKNDKKDNKIGSFDTFDAANNKKTQDAIYKKYNSLLNDFDAYPDFVNPFTTYIAGVYFMLEGDSSKARNLLKESVSMAPKNKQILSDFKLSDKYINSLKNAKENYAWVIYENGQGMVKDEIRIDIPLFLFTSNAYYTGIALPKITERTNSYKHLNINGKKTTQVCNMDNVIKTEFKKRFPMIVTEAVLNTVIKTVAQKQLKDKGGIVGGIVGSLYQGLTNKSDVRSWTALPKEFQSTRVTLNNKPIKIKDDKGNLIQSINIPNGKNALIYVRSRNAGDTKIHQTLF